MPVDQLARALPCDHANIALFTAGFATFALMYCVQPLLPLFATQFHVSPAQAAWTLSATTLVLAVSLLGASAAADRFGRKRVMVSALFASALLGAASAAAPGFAGLLAMRALMGLTLAGLPAVAMTYVVEDVPAAQSGGAIGLFIGGSAIGGMSGRLMAAGLAGAASWRGALLCNAVIGFGCAIMLARLLPADRASHLPARLGGSANLARKLIRHLRDPSLRALFALGFLLMGSFVTTYNYIGFRLAAAPYHLSPHQVGAVFSLYLTGVVSSTLMGKLALRIGPPGAMALGLALMMLGATLTSLAPLIAIMLGVALLTIGFFAAHAVASAAVATNAPGDRAQASALYSFFYYAGSSAMGPVGGIIWHSWGWGALTIFIAAMPALGFVLLGFAQWRAQP